MRRSSGWLATLLFHKTNSGIVQFFRYGIVGGLAFCADFGTLYGLTDGAGVHYLLSAAAGFLVGLTLNYSLSVRWVFSQRKIANKAGEFALFAVIGIAGLGLNELIMWVLTDLMAVYYLGSKIVTTGVVYLWNFFARKLLVF